MKVFAACVSTNGGDDYLFVSLTKSGLEDQILEMARHDFPPAEEDKYYQTNKDEYADHDSYLLEHYYIRVQEEIDL